MATQEIQLPKTGLLFMDLVRFTNLSPEEFHAACPFPFLLQVPVEAPSTPSPSGDGKTTHRLPKVKGGLESTATLDVEPEDILGLVRDRSKKASHTVNIHMIYPHSGNGVVVGRKDSKADVRIDNSTVSKRHAELCPVANMWNVVDLGSSNGTFVDGQRLEPGVVSLVRDRGDLRFGTYQTFFLTSRTLYKLIQKLQGSG